MEVKEIEKLAKMFKVMISAHPEICPHEWKLTYLDENGTHFICKHCGQEETGKTLAIADDKYDLKRTNEYRYDEY